MPTCFGRKFKFFISKFYYSKIWKKIHQEKEAEIGILFWDDVHESKLNLKNSPKNQSFRQN